MIEISTGEYFGPHKPAAEKHVANAHRLLAHVNALLTEARGAGVDLRANPVTGTLVAGATYGGYRPPGSPVGAVQSAHRSGEAVDVYDVGDALDGWLNDEILARHDLYREHPDATAMKPGQVAGWCHLTTRAPRSKRRTFWP